MKPTTIETGRDSGCCLERIVGQQHVNPNGETRKSACCHADVETWTNLDTNTSRHICGKCFNNCDLLPNDLSQATASGGEASKPK